MGRKRLISLALSLTLLLTLTLPAHGEVAGFPDVEDHWARDILERWHSMGVIGGDTGTGAFRPDDPLSRAEFGAMLNRIMGYPLVELRRFTDVPTDAWYAETMSRLNGAGIIQGDGDDMIRPRDPVTRQEAAVILCRALNIPEEEAQILFHDADEIAPWASGAVGALYNMGAVQGYENYFEPQAPISRCQAVKLLDNLIGAAMTSPGTWDQDVEGDMYLNTKRSRLENMTISGDLIVTSGVDTGEVVLSGVTVKGDVILRGCGERAFRLLPDCVLEGELILEKTIEGPLWVINESGQPIPSLRLAAGNSEVTVEGDVTEMSLQCAVPVTLQNSQIETLSLTAPQSSLTLPKGSSVTELTIGTEAKDTLVTVEGSVASLTLNAPARVDNSGKISALHVAANKVVLAGKPATQWTMSRDVSRPRDGNGKVINDIIVK